MNKIELKYDQQRDSFYIDCGDLNNARHILNLLMYATEKMKENKQQNPKPCRYRDCPERDIETRK